MADLRVTLFAHGRAAFLDLLREHNLEFVKEPIEPDTIRASGEVLNLLGVAIPSVAAVLVAWLKARAKRKIILRVGMRTIHIEGPHSVDEVKEILEKAAAEDASITAMVIQTEKDDE